jgi:hypothetical protein
MKITLNNKSYSLKFGLGFFRELGRIYGDDTIQQTLARIVVFDDAKAVSELPYSLLDLLENIVKASALNDRSNVFDENDFESVLDVVLSYPNFIVEFKNAILESMPKQNTDQGKQMAPKKQSAKK